MTAVSILYVSVNKAIHIQVLYSTYIEMWCLNAIPPNVFLNIKIYITETGLAKEKMEENKEGSESAAVLQVTSTPEDLDDISKHLLSPRY